MVWHGGIERLDPSSQRSAALTYAERGATARDVLPAGYRHVRREDEVGSGADDFDVISAALLSWRVHQRAGLRVAATAARAEEGAVVVSRLKAGPVGVTVPCRVVYVVDEPAARGFAYGTLPGHPASGEESFVVGLREDGTVTLSIVAFSRPARWFARLGGPVTRWLQEVVTSRYIAAARKVVAERA